jgi:hypothetical protein
MDAEVAEGGGLYLLRSARDRHEKPEGVAPSSFFEKGRMRRKERLKA